MKYLVWSSECYAILRGYRRKRKQNYRISKPLDIVRDRQRNSYDLGTRLLLCTVMDILTIQCSIEFIQFDVEFNDILFS